jgi:endoglycosylceramidase
MVNVSPQVRCWAAVVVALCTTITGGALPAIARAAPAPSLGFGGPPNHGRQLGHAGRWITDASGRVVVLHGTNMVYKLAPFYPAAAGFDADDAAFLHSIGFNAVRVGVLWQAVEPKPGVYDDRYLKQVAATVRMLGRHGILALLDFHQDMYNQLFQGEGFPRWAVQDGGLPNPRHGFPGNYLTNPALQHAYDNFLANKPGPGGIGLQNRYAAAWAHVARWFRGNPSVLGYEIMNEPFPGSGATVCARPAGCPVKDRELTGLERKVDRAIRSADPRTLVFYEPFATFNFGFKDHIGSLHDPNAVFAWHDYCLTGEVAGCSTHATTMANAAAFVAHSGDGSMMTEFGATTSARNLRQMVSLADHSMVPWTEWAYCYCGDITTSSRQEGLVVNPFKAKTGANLINSVLDSLVEPYPQLIAGTPRSWGYDHSTRMFRLTYATRRASGPGSFPAGSVTAIATPRLDYPNGYVAKVNGGIVISPSKAPVMRVTSSPGAATVTVSIAPGGASS